MDIKSPRRILVLGAPNCGSLSVIEKLTGTSPAPHSNGSTAGLTHEWDVTTQYYTAKLPIWVDEIASVEEWKSEFLKPEAGEVVEAVGAWVFCFRSPSSKKEQDDVEEAMQAIFAVSEAHLEEKANSLMLAVALPTPLRSAEDAARLGREDWEDICLNFGFEYVDFAASGTNEFGEKVGFERLKEALEANEWSDDTDNGLSELDLHDLESGDDEDEGVLERNEAEWTAEMFGLKAALAREGEDEEEVEEFDGLGNVRGTARGQGRGQAGQVDDLERLMGTLLAVKEQSAALPEPERRRLAAKAVEEVMRDVSL